MLIKSVKYINSRAYGYNDSDINSHELIVKIIEENLKKSPCLIMDNLTDYFKNAFDDKYMKNLETEINSITKQFWNNSGIFGNFVISSEDNRLHQNHKKLCILFVIKKIYNNMPDINDIINKFNNYCNKFNNNKNFNTHLITHLLGDPTYLERKLSLFDRMKDHIEKNI